MTGDWIMLDANNNPYTLYQFDHPLVSATSGKRLGGGQAASGSRNQSDAYIFAWQGFFLPDREGQSRLVLTYGYRKDTAKSATFDAASTTQDFSGLFPTVVGRQLRRVWPPPVGHQPQHRRRRPPAEVAERVLQPVDLVRSQRRPLRSVRQRVSRARAATARTTASASICGRTSHAAHQQIRERPRPAARDEPDQRSRPRLMFNVDKRVRAARPVAAHHQRQRRQPPRLPQRRPAQLLDHVGFRRRRATRSNSTSRRRATGTSGSMARSPKPSNTNIGSPWFDWVRQREPVWKSSSRRTAKSTQQGNPVTWATAPSGGHDTERPDAEPTTMRMISWRSRLRSSKPSTAARPTPPVRLAPISSPTTASMKAVCADSISVVPPAGAPHPTSATEPSSAPPACPNSTSTRSSAANVSSISMGSSATAAA